MKVLKKRLSLLTISLCFAAVLLLSWMVSVFSDVLGWGSGREILVNIPKGTGVAGIADILKREGVIKHRVLFRLFEKSGRDEHVFQQGGHMLASGMSYSEIISKLMQLPEVPIDESVKVLIPEGYETRQIAQVLEELGLADGDEFMKELDEGDFEYEFVSQIERRENRLEGYLFPATYEINPGESVHEIINRMLKKFSEVVVPLYEAWDNPKGYSLDRVVTLASMVEREAANESEQGLVASVFFNRMDKDMTLSSCATVQYILQERKKILSNSDIKIKSGYNTYINKGLPVGPVASPGESSVRAVLYPASSDYLYFAAKADGSANVFSKTGEEHMRKVKEIQGY